MIKTDLTVSGGSPDGHARLQSRIASRWISRRHALPGFYDFVQEGNAILLKREFVSIVAVSPSIAFLSLQRIAQNPNFSPKTVAVAATL
tara:strand:- start:168 stop:434 length:267 start_codon:yes stop_codon:yes gene_type:complete